MRMRKLEVENIVHLNVHTLFRHSELGTIELNFNNEIKTTKIFDKNDLAGFHFGGGEFLGFLPTLGV